MKVLTNYYSNRSCRLVVVQQSQSSDKKTVRLVVVFSFSNFVIVVEFIVETQTPQNHFKFTIDVAIFW